MSKKMYVIKDSKANFCYPPEVYRNQAEAVRAVENSVKNQKESMLSKNAEDFSLFEVGEYDELTGLIKASEKKHIIDLIDLTTQQ